jgi:heme-degrading monooxygenase HmoA
VIIIAGHEIVTAEERDDFVAAHRDLVSRAREFDGNIHFAITADSVDPERVNTIEVWQDADVMNEWRKVANAPEVGEPKHMDVKRYDATDGGPLF